MTPPTANVTNSNNQVNTFDVETVASNRHVEETVFDDETASEPQAQGSSTVIQATKNFFFGKVFLAALALLALMSASAFVGASMNTNKFVASLNSAQPPLGSKSSKSPKSGTGDGGDDGDGGDSDNSGYCENSCTQCGYVPPTPTPCCLNKPPTFVCCNDFIDGCCSIAESYGACSIPCGSGGD